MADTTKIALRGEAFGPDGPDLGFLRLYGVLLDAIIAMWPGETAEA